MGPHCGAAYLILVYPTMIPAAHNLCTGLVEVLVPLIRGVSQFEIFPTKTQKPRRKTTVK